MKFNQALLIICVVAVPSLTFTQTTPAGLQVSPTSIDFGEISVATDAPPRTITVTNPTTSPVTIEQIIASGIDFSEKHNCGLTLQPGAQCNIEVTFTPAITGVRTGNLDIMGSDLASPHFVALNGAGK